MYKISVPLMNSIVKRSGREKVLKELKRFGAERVFLALSTYELEEKEREAVFRELADNCQFFKENGYEVGAWIWTFWVKGNQEFRNMRSINGTEIGEFMCPSDEKFVAFACDYIKNIAQCGVDVIMFDDDFRYGFLSDAPACLCDAHIEEINRMTGRSLTIDEIREHILTGGKNEIRDAYLKANGDAFRNFATRIRQAVDEVNSQIRVGACACLTSWDIDGIDAFELAHILAGGTKPFVRLIGAPYWAVGKTWGNCLQDVIELERMESAWTKQGDIEMLAEGDVYPRPRTSCPASYLEGFDTAMRAVGCTDGILKYGIDYCSNADYETGYAKFHERNQKLYDEITRLFANKKHCGVRIYESMNKVSDMVMPTKINKTVDIQNFIFSKAARTLAFNTIPSVYEGNGVCGIVFDENARNLSLEALDNGLILDIAAAEILMERGVDVGVEWIGNEVRPSGCCTSDASEHFVNDNNYIAMYDSIIYDIKLKEDAEILSDVNVDEGLIPVSFRYENAKGQRFLVLNINTRIGADVLLKHYARSRQYAEAVEWISGQRLPAYVYGHPSLYIQCKEDEDELAVGLWNFSVDTVIEPVVELGDKYADIEFVNCTGRLEADKVYLTDISPHGFAGFVVKG